VIVRLARAEDIPELALMGKEFFDLTRYAENTEYDYSSIIKCLAGMIKTDSLFVAADGEIKAFIGLIVTPICWNENQTIANELFWWGTPRGMVLVYEEAVRQLDADYLCMSTLENMKPETTCRFYEKRGFENMGNFYIKDLRCHP